MKLQNKLASLALILALALVTLFGQAAFASSDGSTDPYFRLLADLKKSVDEAQQELGNCGSNQECLLTAGAKRNMSNINAGIASEARNQNPGNSSAAFIYLFAMMAARPLEIKRDLVRCGITHKSCQVIAKAMMDQNFEDELRAHRAFSAYAQSEMARLQSIANSCSSGTAQSASTGYGAGGGISDAFRTAPTTVD